jgi:hypothetical protein
MLRAYVNIAKTVISALARAGNGACCGFSNFKLNLTAHYLLSVFLTKVPFLPLGWSLFSLCNMYLLPAFASCEGGWGER